MLNNRAAGEGEGGTGRARRPRGLIAKRDAPARSERLFAPMFAGERDACAELTPSMCRAIRFLYFPVLYTRFWARGSEESCELCVGGGGRWIFKVGSRDFSWGFFNQELGIVARRVVGGCK